MQSLGSHTHTMRGAPEGCAEADSEGIQKSYGSGDISSEAEREESVIGWAVLDGWLLCSDSCGARRMERSGTVRKESRQTARRASSTQAFLISRALGAGWFNKVAPRALRLSPRQATGIGAEKTETARYANVKTKNHIDPRAKSAGNCQLKGDRNGIFSK